MKRYVCIFVIQLCCCNAVMTTTIFCFENVSPWCIKHRRKDGRLDQFTLFKTDGFRNTIASLRKNPWHRVHDMKGSTIAPPVHVYHFGFADSTALANRVDLRRTNSLCYSARVFMFQKTRRCFKKRKSYPPVLDP